MWDKLINTNICYMGRGGSQIASKYEEIVYLVGIINRHATLFSPVKHGGRKTRLGRRSIPLECLVFIRTFPGGKEKPLGGSTTHHSFTDCRQACRLIPSLLHLSCRLRTFSQLLGDTLTQLRKIRNLSNGAIDCGQRRVTQTDRNCFFFYRFVFPSNSGKWQIFFNVQKEQKKNELIFSPEMDNVRFTGKFVRIYADY